VWPEILTAAVLSLANLTLLALAATGLVRFLLPLVRRAGLDTSDGRACGKAVRAGHDHPQKC
jgi:hypothetical protein